MYRILRDSETLVLSGVLHMCHPIRSCVRNIKPLLIVALVLAFASPFAEAGRRCKRRYSTYCAPCPVSICPSCATATANIPGAMQPTAPVAFVHRGVSYSWAPVAGIGTEEELEEEIAARPPHERAMAASNTENFAGHDRKKPKTSISTAPVEDFTDLAALLASLTPDDQMLNHTPPVLKDPDFDRVAEEQRNVRVSGAIAAIKKEPDNDFHVILASTGSASADFMNIEISGLPTTGPNRAPLAAVRASLRQFLTANGVNVTSSYIKFNPPIPVTVTGSLFYDIDHAPGVVGPSGMRPKTSWEIHPVTELTFP
ncbi:MAG: hypothetical protein JWM11_4960 [Planctomycetaceae bacterium]|nr:hypothetical protein [Planctomycetaceae bacterium]